MREHGMRAGYGRGAAMSRARFAGGMMVKRLLMAVYVVIGLLVAADHNYLRGARLDTLEGILEALLAVVLWPLVLLGVSMRL